MFNNRLREIRMARKYTQQYTADALDIALRSYQCYEGGSRNPSFDMLIKIADFFDVSTDYLLCRDEWLKSHGVSVDECL